MDGDGENAASQGPARDSKQILVMDQRDEVLKEDRDELSQEGDASARIESPKDSNLKRRGCGDG